MVLAVINWHSTGCASARLKVCTAKVAPVLVMYQLVTVLLKLGQVAFSSAGSCWTLAEIARSYLLANSASPGFAPPFLMFIVRRLEKLGVRLSAPHGQPVLCTLLEIVWLQLCVAVNVKITTVQSQHPQLVLQLSRGESL